MVMDMEPAAGVVDTRLSSWWPKLPVDIPVVVAVVMVIPVVVISVTPEADMLWHTNQYKEAAMEEHMVEDTEVAMEAAMGVVMEGADMEVADMEVNYYILIFLKFRPNSKQC